MKRQIIEMVAFVAVFYIVLLGAWWYFIGH